MILIISDLADTQTYSVTHYLDRWGVNHAQWNVSDFPTKTTLRYGTRNDPFSWALSLPCGAVLTRESIKAVWYRKPDTPLLDERLPYDQTAHALAECRAAVSAVFTTLEDLPWVSPLPCIKRAEDKLLQLRIARGLGFEIPDTLATNSPSDAWRFAQRHDGRIAYKALSSPILNYDAIQLGERQRVLFTTLLDVTSEHDLQSVQYAPCLLQNYVPKSYELRVTVVDDKVFAAKICSQGTAGAEIDWRRELWSVGYEPYDLPDELQTLCRKLVASLRLRFGAIDLIRTTSGQYVFLEINPNGQYGWIEETCALPISKAIAHALSAPPVSSR
jgi:glutathione synthase/RimK-type ligase-like ATP-grasp enzyme